MAEAVRFAAALGWPSVVDGGPLRLGYQDGTFTTVRKSAEPPTAADRGLGSE